MDLQVHDRRVNRTGVGRWRTSSVLVAHSVGFVWNADRAVSMQRYQWPPREGAECT